MDIKVEKAKREDIPNIIDLSKKNIEYHKMFDESSYNNSEQVFEMYENHLHCVISSPFNAIFIAKENEKIIGYMIGKILMKKVHENAKKTGEIDDAYVLEEFQNKGIGGRIQQELEEWFSSNGVDVLYVLVDERNNKGVYAWKKYGFENYMLKLKKNI